MCIAVQIQYSAAYKVKFLWQFTINMQHEDKKFIQHKIQYTVAQCRLGVEVSREKRPNEQKFKKGGGNLVFVLLCFNYSTKNTHTCACRHTHYLICMYISRVAYYKYGDISSKTVVMLPYFVHMHVSFQAKEVNAPKGEEQVFFMTAGTTLVEHEARFVLGSTAVLRNSREIKIYMSQCWTANSLKTNL